MTLNGPQRRTLHKVMVDAFRDRNELERMVSLNLNERLNLISGVTDLEHTVFELIQWAESEGRIEDLITALHAAKPRNAHFRELATQFGVSTSSTPTISDPEDGAISTPEGVPRTVTYSTPNIRQLLDAAFNDQELRILCADYFPEVYNNFAGGQTKSEHIGMLLDYVRRRNLFPELLASAKERNSAKYTEYELRLYSVS